MKILFDHTLPFALAHGGFQTQIEETMAALARQGVEVEHVRWWDDRQRGDLIHVFGAPEMVYLEMARQQRLPTVVTHLFTATCNRSEARLWLQGALLRSLALLPGSLGPRLSGGVFRAADRMVVGLEAECRVLEMVYGRPSDTTSQIPLGLPDDFLRVPPATRDQPFLITTGTITQRKRSLELARLAREAQVPILFVGKAYGSDDAYGKEFLDMVDDRMVIHRNHIADRIELIRLLGSSRGFVIYSRYENWCLSAHEAAACGLPVLLPDLPWSRECFGAAASYFEAGAGRGNVERLRAFYDACPTLPGPRLKFYSWDEVGARFTDIYRKLLSAG